MPIAICYSFSYVVVCMSPSVAVPGLINLFDKGFGREKGISSSLIAAATFENLLGIVIFGIVSSIALMEISSDDDQNAVVDIIMIFVQIIVGLILGILLGQTARLFKYI